MKQIVNGLKPGGRCCTCRDDRERGARLAHLQGPDVRSELACNNFIESQSQKLTHQHKALL